MDTLKHLKNPAWCKLDWDLPELTPEAVTLLKQCADLPEVKPTDDINELIKNSNAFPVPFPINSVRLAELKKRIPIDVLQKNITSTYPVVHERVLRLMGLFLAYKREHGSNIEKALYKDMTIPGLIDRILKKRAMCFMSRFDKYMLRDGEKGNNGWEAIGTPKQRPPLTLDNLLSYDELKLSAMVYVSSYTSCINDGARKNMGVVNENNIEDNPVIIGVIGPRFQREARMDCEDILITEKQNRKENGYGDVTSGQATWRKLWADFYEIPSSTYTDASSKLDAQPTKSQNLKKDERQYTDRYITIAKTGAIFDNEAYHKRLSIIAESSLLEAEARARDSGKKAYLNVIGAGLGVWKVSSHQNDVFVLSFVECMRALLKRDALRHVTDVNFAYIKATRALQAYFKSKPGVIEKSGFVEDKGHPNDIGLMSVDGYSSGGKPKKIWMDVLCGGIHIYLEDREPSSKLRGKHAGKLLVMTYPWDGNAHPGNEFWMGKLGSSGDPAAACSTQISELHNAYINPAASSAHTRVVTSTDLLTLREYAQNIDK